MLTSLAITERSDNAYEDERKQSLLDKYLRPTLTKVIASLCEKNQSNVSKAPVCRNTQLRKTGTKLATQRFSLTRPPMAVDSAARSVTCYSDKVGPGCRKQFCLLQPGGST